MRNVVRCNLNRNKGILSNPKSQQPLSTLQQAEGAQVDAKSSRKEITPWQITHENFFRET